MPKRRSLSSSDDDVYHVEVITSARVNDEAEWEYLVSWAGYSSEEDSWEPAENVEQCDRLLRSFWKHIGTDNEDYSPGDQFDAEDWWIRKEREYFANIWRDKAKKKKKAAKDKHYSFTVSGAGSSGPKTSKKKLNKALEEFVQQQNDSQSDDDSDDSDEVPLSRSLAAKSKGQLSPIQRHKGVHRQDESEDELPRAHDEMRQKARCPRGAPGTSTMTRARPPNSTLRNKRRWEYSSSENETDEFPNGPLGKRTKTSQPTLTTTPATPPRRDTNISHIRESPSSLFSAPSSPAPILPPQPASPNPSMPPPLQANAAEPPRRPPLPKPTATGSQSKAVRKPTWFFAPKIKRFDAPNLKPGSTLPTKASLGTVRTSDLSQPSTSGRRGSIQTPTEASTPERSAFLGPGPNVDTQYPESPPQLAEVETPTMQDVPRLPPASSAETEAFLRNLMPPEMSESMIDGVEPSRPTPLPVRKQSTSDLLKSTTIPRKFKWSGELRMNTGKDHKERLCNVTLSDTSDGSTARLRFSICYGPSVSFLVLEKLFSLGELQCLRPALTPVTEIGKLGPETQADEKPISTLFYYMSSRKLVSCSRVHIDDNQVALLLVFPATNLVLCKEYNVRPEMRKAGHFIAALLPWKVVGTKARAHRLFRDPCDRTHGIYRPGGKTESIVMAERQRSAGLRKDPSYHRAVSILRIPKWLYDEMPKSKYCIWNKDGDGPSEPGFETRALIHVLKKRGAEDVGFKADVSFVFVHVGAIKTLYRLPALMERRMKRLDIRFVTYGTHHTIPPARWGVRQIYPAGGIASVSPSVFAECPSAAYRLLDMLEQHPLWDCFVTPGVVALAARQNLGSDPISEFEKGTLMHQDLLSRIGQGQVSLLSMEPPQYGTKDGLVTEWIRRHQETSMLEPRGILEECLRSFNKQFSDFPEEKWTFEVIKELLSMQFSLQTQPCMMDQYRRFVVITGKQDKIAPDWGGLEWANIDAFNFRDDFFSKEKLDDLRSWASVEHALFTLQSPSVL